MNVDPLRILARDRVAVVRANRAPADTLAAFLAPTTRRMYREARARAMRPVRLPGVAA